MINAEASMTGALVRNIRLLTFSRLSLSDVDALGEAAEELSARSVVFENHYLQTSGLTGILSGMDAATTAGNMNSRAVFVAASRDDPDSGVDLSDLPSHWETRRCHWPADDSAVRDLSDLQDADLVWMHADGSAVAEFVAAVSALQGICDRNSVMIVTALQGATDPVDGPFESLLAESQIRVPLWLCRPDRRVARVQTITGSSDVGCTIRGVLCDPGPATNHSDPDVDAPRCLMSVAEFPGTTVPRRIHVRGAGCRAVRTSDFLFVECDGQARETGSDSSLFALYAKPADVWNVHDVAGEYLDIVDELRGCLV